MYFRSQVSCCGKHVDKVPFEVTLFSKICEIRPSTVSPDCQPTFNASGTNVGSGPSPDKRTVMLGPDAAILQAENDAAPRKGSWTSKDAGQSRDFRNGSAVRSRRRTHSGHAPGSYPQKSTRNRIPGQDYRRFFQSTTLFCVQRGSSGPTPYKKKDRQNAKRDVCVRQRAYIA